MRSTRSVGVIRVDDLDGEADRDPLPLLGPSRDGRQPRRWSRRPTIRAPPARWSSEASAGSRSSCRAAAATSTRASGSATRSTAGTRRTASAWSSAARCSRSPRASGPTPPRRADAARHRPEHPLHPVAAGRAATRAPPSGPRRRPPARVQRAAAAARPGRSTRTGRRPRRGVAGVTRGTWEVRVARSTRLGARTLVAAVEDGHPTCDLSLQALRVNDIVHSRHERRDVLRDRSRDQGPLAPPRHVRARLHERARRRTCRGRRTTRKGGWGLDASYAVPDLIPQAWGMPVALAPDSEQRAVDGSLELIRRLSVEP